MPLIDFSTLVTTRTAEEVRDSLLALLDAGDFPVASWASTSLIRGILESESAALADAYNLVSQIAKGGYLDFAEQAWLTLLADQVHSVTREPATTLLGVVRIANSTGSDIDAPAGQWIETASGLRYQTTVTRTIPAHAFLEDVVVQAESPGSAYNVGNGDIVTVLTPIPGLSWSNPAFGTTGTSITSAGTDEESDPNLRIRCRARWGSLGTGTTDGYIYWARTASALVTRASVLEDVPSGGHVTVVVAGAAGALSPTDLTPIDAVLQLRRPLCVTVHTETAANVLYTVTGTLYVRAAYASAALGRAETALTALFASIDIGGRIEIAAIVATLMGIPGVTNVALLDPLGGGSYREVYASDVILSPRQVAVHGTALTVTSV